MLKIAGLPGLHIMRKLKRSPLSDGDVDVDDVMMIMIAYVGDQHNWPNSLTRLLGQCTCCHDPLDNGLAMHRLARHPDHMKYDLSGYPAVATPWTARLPGPSACLSWSLSLHLVGLPAYLTAVASAGPRSRQSVEGRCFALDLQPSRHQQATQQRRAHSHVSGVAHSVCCQAGWNRSVSRG
ncbi:unnamed protein product [Protopolystoma xenopodis]|uniref:Uncharacterized protein n=1 Tax=Protopolystoma xenopodis TaxID=117903 RepID=A0A448X4L0_9PLAT|nr:unnamed protein product [Protopolystoma xenopodis]